MNMSRLTLISVISLVIAAVICLNIYHASTRMPERAYSSFLADIRSGRIEEVSIKGGVVTGVAIDGQIFTTFSPDVPGLIPLLESADILIKTRSAPSTATLYRDMLLILLLLGGWSLLNRKSSNSAKFLRNKTFRSQQSNSSRVTFEDVGGISEAREELKEIIDFLKYPAKYSRLGGRIPKGVLLQGPPGTGKTLLAKAIAGEASVPFFSIGGSDFVEMFAGLGASRVRRLFEEAKKQAPCIIFIDEIDAIGGRRSGDYGNGSNDEREQTLNALLVEMDGFETNETVIVVGATNRSDILDLALLRPGRFDRRITLTLPDIRGRLKILKVHTAKTSIDSSVDLSIIARSTPGFSGAEIANLVNEAALLAARRGKEGVEPVDFEDAKDKIIMGIERKNAVISQEARRLTAYHEAGHAVVAKLLPETDPLHKITIIPRGQSLGLTQQLPFDDHLTHSRSYLLNKVMILLGGRIAEEVVFGRLTTGASNDLLAATHIAHRVVCEFGMSEQIGPVSCSGGPRGNTADPASVNWQQSQQTLREIDLEIRDLISSCYDTSRDLLKANSDFLHMLAESVLANETLDGEEVDIVYRCYLDRRLVEEKQGAIKQN